MLYVLQFTGNNIWKAMYFSKQVYLKTQTRDSVKKYLAQYIHIQCKLQKP